MSLINVNGQVDQNSATQLAAQLAQIIQAAPDTPAKTNFIRDLAARLGVSVSTPAQNEEDEGDDENRVDYRDEHECERYGGGGHDVIEQRGKLVFIDDRCWDEDFASIIFGGNDPSDYIAFDFDDVACDCTPLSIDTALDNVDEAIEKLEAVKRTLKKCKDNGGRYVIWNNDRDFDYETGDPENISRPSE